MVETSTDTLGKRKYFSELVASRLSLMKVAKEGGILGTVQDRQRGKDIWRNVAEHQLVQASACEVLGDFLGWDKERTSKLVDAALVHDWDKPFQSTGLRKINGRVASGEISDEDGGKVKYDFFEESEEHSTDGMRRFGVNPEVIKIASADGHPALPRVMRIDSSLEERVFHYIGSITDQDKIVPLDERIKNLENNARYAMMNEYGRQVPWTAGKTLYETQREVGHRIEGEITGLLLERDTVSADIKDRLRANPSDLPQVIKETVLSKFS
ncbi:MAG: hypothetical protein A3A58_00265 [Candidatus Blackburnbacteria bacterium RIFCSPLOWO2_01_FULL_41_27]|uniref:HD domain-containing protein n=2 Tax=Candidatus Blackburniibacteriota TaxID=1817898 RepID=A0A1G1VBY4_9BACT|nr:MAG: hypothetical protein A3A58_00265 [Candidatus Blackburnbacteria bacterium RIFCSPLOWO2_01_FULL_41_27]OGY12919.1 MAG: hypothetical protein A3F61_00650 [Candidatus Blackburnbacteria bacterium RIFCSPHIGHO2_12_FULL_41_13b]